MSNPRIKLSILSRGEEKKISNEFLLDAKRCYPRGALDELLRFERAERRKGGRKSAEEIQERGTFNLRLSLPPSRGKKLRLRDNKASADPFETSIENRAALSRRFACTLPSCGSWGRNIQGGVWFLKILGETLPLFSILSSSSFFFFLCLDVGNFCNEDVFYGHFVIGRDRI